ncbi:hypothetical protein [Halostagnicola sp. A-GB9-2]|uniref:hypothetical protein n=1 Tax=Halostagnicola sp. A-GB9-2 TaxID=3048066 RepID=UPI0024BFBED7|nr:hypothetical protein [Halostagnicola sp. A-GB9-2]MDJ1432753.1 hypothetical protein [Halostagnicola sp. A-GB9-2]
MNIRDALEADADALASIADSPTDVMRNLVHDRTVRVAEDSTHDPNADITTGETQYNESNPEDLLGFVSFDAKDDTVHVTQIGGTDDACVELLAEPVRFAECESMTVELLIAPDADGVKDAAAELGFQNCGSGPRFENSRTQKFQLEP